MKKLKKRKIGSRQLPKLGCLLEGLMFESLLLLFLFSASVVCSSKQAKRASEEQ
jgi:hypothetical protein